ncbi:ribokinase [Saccharopolyspora griseoalba]|uniref:Ribokinase n=1 Tax=Saccharopolyspora griseoalba TaxID=1431848 RepID=A0ABW2LKB3_9PSEU
MTTSVAVFGSCNMDLVAYVPTAPRRGETVMGREFHTVPGGKGANQAIAAAKAGAYTSMIGAVGTDEFGEEIRKVLTSAGVDVAGLRSIPGRSGTAHIVVDDDGANSIVVVPAANSALETFNDSDEELVADSSALLLQLETPLSGVTAAAAAGRRHGVKVVLTPAPAVPLSDELLANVDLLVPNEHEAAVLTGNSDPDQALEELLRKVPEVVITLGDRGCLYGNREGVQTRVPSHRVTAVDSTAAGDTFVGVLSAVLGGGATMPEAMRMASAGAALSVQRPGASSSMPDRQEIVRFVAER